MNLFEKWRLILLALLLQHATHGTLEVGDAVCVAGYVMDHSCIKLGYLLDDKDVDTLSGDGPLEHSVHCLIDVGYCRNSPFEILVATKDGGFGRAWRLQDNALVVAHARKIGSCGSCDDGYGGSGPKKGYRVTVQATVSSLGDVDEENRITPVVLDVTQVDDYEDYDDVCGAVAEQQCSDHTDDCHGCLTAGCVMTNGGECMDDYYVADVGYYQLASDGFTTTDVCARRASDNADNAACFSTNITTCGECTGTALPSDASKTCMWFQEDDFCGNACGLMGCGVTKCTDDDGVLCNRGHRWRQWLLQKTWSDLGFGR